MPELTDISVIRALCEKYDFALSKGFGQNFIINPGIPTKIVDASGVDKRYGVIEIGPGIGVLTKELAKRAAKVVSIEVDERLPPLLAETMAGVDNFKLVLQDVLKVDLKALIAAEFPGMPVAVCANLPYYITSPIVMKLLGDRRDHGRGGQLQAGAAGRAEGGPESPHCGRVPGHAGGRVRQPALLHHQPHRHEAAGRPPRPWPGWTTSSWCCRTC